MGKIKTELQHIQFPSRKAIIKNTAFTIAVSVVSSLFLFGIQVSVTQIIKYILS